MTADNTPAGERPAPLSPELQAVLDRALAPSAERAQEAAAELKSWGDERLQYLFADDVHPGEDRDTMPLDKFLDVQRTASARQDGREDPPLKGQADAPTTHRTSKPTPKAHER